MMNIKNLMSATLVTTIALLSMNAVANNVDVNAARAAAGNYLKVHAAATPGSLKAPATADLKLAYTEASSVDRNANAYYAFNITGGGFVIIAGEDRANQVLGYSDRGHLDFNNLPDNFKALLDGYKEEIEYLQSHPALNVTPAVRASNGNGVEPLIKTYWGQEMPYYNQCPVYNGEYCVVGCVATAMAQVMKYWRYPTTSPEVSSYYCYDIGQTVPALPETSFNYDKMLSSYCHWDWDRSELIQDTYTTEQADAVAKLSRYCGQAVRMGYSPEGSGAYTSDQLDAMIDFGYSSSARDVMRSSWWGTSYSTQEWEAMIREELDMKRPILYAANDPTAGGHAFICDGYNSEGLFHFNFGWYGTCDGWYASTALNMTHRDGDYLRFNSGHEMLLGVVPPSYCIISAAQLEVPSGLHVLGESLDIQATDVNILTTNSFVNLIFTLNNETGRRVYSSPAMRITPSEFEQGSTVQSAATLATTLTTGRYTLGIYYYFDSPRMSTAVECPAGELNVIGHFAKYNEPFNIVDVTTAIDYLLDDSQSAVTISDITSLIDALLEG